MRIRRIFTAAILGVCVAAAGCAQSNRGTTSDGQIGSSGGSKVPTDARRVSEATGSRLVHRPLREGTIYVVDGENDRILFKGPVRANSNVVVDPAANAITVNDQQVKPGAKLEPRHTYRLYFRQK